jgi:uncharacterized membrane protein
MPYQGIVPVVLPLHILAGAVALLAGYLALYAAKGATLHKRSGLLFVVAMVTMSLTGALIAVLNGSTTSVFAGLLTFYFVTTSLLTVRRGFGEFHWINVIAAAFAFTVGLFAFGSGFQLMSTGRPETGPMFIFGIVALLAVVGDVRVIRQRGIQGPRRIARHLWRMCFAMWVAAASFFWGPPGRVPELIRIPALLPIPVLIPVFAMLYWLWRIRVKQRLTGIVGVRA